MENNSLFFNPPSAGDVETTTHVEGQTEQGQDHTIIPGLTSIVIACYNTNYATFHYLGHAIRSIHDHTDPEKTPYELIIVDNGSPVKHSKLGDYMADKVIVNEQNKGVSAAWNQGIRVSQGEYICLLNSDAMVFEHWLEDMQLAITQGKLDLVMAHPMYGQAYAGGREAADKRAQWVDKPIEESFDFFNDFSCVLSTRDVFDKVGLFDEQFFMYMEDLDFLKRMDELNLTYRCCNRVNTFHIIGATTTGMDETPEIMNQSKEKFKQKWGE